MSSMFLKKQVLILELSLHLQTSNLHQPPCICVKFDFVMFPITLIYITLKEWGWSLPLEAGLNGGPGTSGKV